MRLKVMASAVCLLFVLVAAASSSNAAPGGKFTLPFTAQWGGTVLPAGTYTFTVISNVGSIRYLDVRGKKVSAYILPAELEIGTNASHSHLTTVSLGNDHFIERLDLKEGDMAFEFRLPKGARTPADLTRVMVSHMGNGS